MLPEAVQSAHRIPVARYAFGKTMKAFVMKRIGEVGFIDKAIPNAVALTGAIVSTTRALVCTSDVLAVEGTVGERENLTLGHEAVGVIHRLGREVKGFKVGDRVVVNAARLCYRREKCRPGQILQCPMTPGFSKFSNINFHDGVFSEYFHVFDAEATLVLIPDAISDDIAVYVGDVLNTGMLGAERANIPPGGTVAVFGQGPVGLMATAGAKFLGAEHIIAVESIPKRQQLARHFGADLVVDHTQSNPVEHIMRLTGGHGVDSAIDAVGSQKTFDNCIKVTRPGGAVSTVGYFGHGDYVKNPHVEWSGGKIIRTGLCPGGKERMQRLLRLIETGHVDPTPLTTHRFRFEQIDKAFQLMRTKEGGVIKPLIVFNNHN